jgi:adenylate kinase family enzyme
VHFDFGNNLRQMVARNEPDADITADEIVFLRQVLQTGALLEDQDFPLAERILSSFLRRSGADAHTWVMMNGLPRHLGQAQALVDRLDVRHILVLECSPQVVLDRIARNTGGDRTHRIDDDVRAIERKLEIYSRRTQPLVDFYVSAGAELHELEVTAAATAADMWHRFSQEQLRN